MQHPLIAIVDDDRPCVEMMDDLLSEEGYATIGCTAASEALDVIREHHPDLVIMDIGIRRSKQRHEMLDVLRCAPASSTPPLIVLSTENGELEGDETWLKSKPAVFIQKPFEISTLLTHVTQLIGPPPAEATRS
ncbi:MAG: response regulator [Chloroflexota bacterium]|nr:MAG: hypothetical protein DIU80_10705 [Chloroflexota bacterium]